MVKTSKKRRSTQKPELLPAWPSFRWPDLDRTFDNFRRDFERALSSFPAVTMPSMPQVVSNTHCDIVDEGNELIVKVDVPGVNKKDIELNVTENAIEISAEHVEEEEEKKKNYLRRERSDYSYYRNIALPEKVVSSKAKAKLADGVLNIVLPKATPTKRPKKNSVRVQ